MVHERFKVALARRYETVKAQHPGEGRRKLKLRVLYDSWPSFTTADTHEVQSIGDDGLTSFTTDPDPLDAVLEDGELGLILRTDFTNDDSWRSFAEKVMASQYELISDMQQSGTGDADPKDGSTSVEDVAMKDTSEEAEDEDSESSTEIPEIIKILDPTDPTERQKFSNISNIAALRLFNDVDIRPSPPRPSGIKPRTPQNPLIDQGGLQEIYTGQNIWIYDTLSNKDGCVRVVSQAGDFYGTATGDSWRARGSHICQLQLDIAYQGLQINFDGADRWDPDAREQNLREGPNL